MSKNLNYILVSSEVAPSGSYPVLTRNADGVPQAYHTGPPSVQGISSAAAAHDPCPRLFYAILTVSGLTRYMLRLS